MHATRAPPIATVSTGLLGSPYGVFVGLRVTTSNPSRANPLPTMSAHDVIVAPRRRRCRRARANARDSPCRCRTRRRRRRRLRVRQRHGLSRALARARRHLRRRGATMTSWALIVGSGFARLGFDVVTRSPTKTPYGEPSSPVLTVAIGGARVACIVRHGGGGTIAPHEINYRANVWALKERGVRHCIGINTVGAIAATFRPGELAVPDQLIDYTH